MNFLKLLFKYTRRRHKFKTFLILTVVSLIYWVLMSHKRQDENAKSSKSIESIFQEKNKIIRTKFEGEKLVHFDLKGAPPKISYLIQILPLIKEMGASGILVEYEDTFPYHSDLEDIKATNAYTRSDIESLLEEARKNSLIVIPLIPTLSHFEFVLKHSKYTGFRESKKAPDILCPSKRMVYQILRKMIDQILEVHDTSEYFHIGCNDAENVGTCDKCRKYMRENKWKTTDLYFNHVRKVAEYIVKTYPKVRPIMWSSKFLKANKSIIQHRIPHLVDVMLWNYHPDKDKYPEMHDMNLWANTFNAIWIASAFKGTTGSHQIVTNIDFHLRNTEGWMELVEEWKSKIKFKGIALTGWQRYGHFMVLCELLPVGIPSLAMNLKQLGGQEYDVIKLSLNCNDFVPVNMQEIQDLNVLSRLKCNFPGFRIYLLTHALYNTVLYVKHALRKSDMMFYSTVHNASNPVQVENLSEEIYQRLLYEVNELQNKLKVALTEVYDKDTVNEWILTHLIPVRLRLEAAFNLIHTLSNTRVRSEPSKQNVKPKMKKNLDDICNNNRTKACEFYNMHIREQ